MTDKARAMLGDYEAAELTHLSLFSGIGGLDLAAEMAGFRKVWGAIGHKPLFGHHSGKQSRTFWACFMKLEEMEMLEGLE